MKIIKAGISLAYIVGSKYCERDRKPDAENSPRKARIPTAAQPDRTRATESDPNRAKDINTLLTDALDEVIPSALCS
jgi:hypothetical protein